MDVYTGHQRLMLLHWPSLLIGTGLDVLGRQQGSSFQGFKFTGHRVSMLVAAVIRVRYRRARGRGLINQL